MTTIVKSVQINPGESFTLPPGASIVAVTGTLSNSCGTLPNPEDLTCYGIIYSVSDGSTTPSETNEDVTIKGFRIDNEEYLFTSPYSHNAGVTYTSLEIENRVSTQTYLAGIISNICGGRYTTSSGRGGVYVISFKCIPSLMQNAQIIIDQASYPGAPATRALIPIRTRAELATDGLPSGNCPCV